MPRTTAKFFVIVKVFVRVFVRVFVFVIVIVKVTVNVGVIAHAYKKFFPEKNATLPLALCL